MPAFHTGSLHALKALWRDQEGVTALSTGLLLTVTMGFVGLGIDVGAAYYAKRDAQNAADSAAYSGAAALAAIDTDAVSQARAVAAGYGFIDGADGTVVTVNTPPAVGKNSGSRSSVEVIIDRPARRFFSGFFSSGESRIRGRAVAEINTAANACVVALHQTAEASASEAGTANINLNGCSLFSNSSASTAFELKGTATLRAESVGVVGGYNLSSNSLLETVQGIHKGQNAISDPYKDVPIPAYSGCTHNSATLSTGTYGGGSTPTVFCNGLTINAGAVVHLQPGIYVVDRGLLKVNGGGVLTGDGVTIILTSSTGTGHATAQINGGAIIDLKAPTEGLTRGLVFYQDRAAQAGSTNMLVGGSTQHLFGAVYFPNQNVLFTGGSETVAGCTQIVASQVAFRGNSDLEINCGPNGVRRAVGPVALLVE